MTLTAARQLPAFEAHGRVVNGCQSARRRIGTYHHRDAGRIFAEPQEVAAWHRHGTFPAGDYPIYECIGYPPGSSYVLVELTGGAVTSACFVSLFGGNRFGRDSGPDEVGQPFSHHFEIGSFGLPEADKERFTFDPAIEIRDMGTYSDGRPMRRAYDPQTGKPIGR
jgi:hypothetical protein